MENAKNVWGSAWKKETHETDYARKRISSARTAKLTPVKIDHDDMYGYFQGSHGRYETWLDNCSCGDFIRSHLPCKHIYRLAMELGALDIEYSSNNNAIPCVRSDLASLSDTVDILESLPLDSQKVILRIVTSTTHDNPVKNIKYSDGVEDALRSGILVEESRTPKMIKLRISENYPRRKIHYYLHRKFDNESYYNPDADDFTDIPLLKTELPDDDVTAELIKRGYYKRK